KATKKKKCLKNAVINSIAVLCDRARIRAVTRPGTECVRLFRQKEKETFPDSGVGEERLVTVPPPEPRRPAAENVRLLYSALSRCVCLLDRAVDREDDELGVEEDSEYLRQRKAVRERLAHLARSTKSLLVDGGGTAAQPTNPPLEILCDPDGPTGTFALKLWIYQVLHEVVRWTNTAFEVLHSLPAEQKKQTRLSRKRKRGRAGARK
uniref:Ciliary neurotrophic factor n=1 Tax=Denticeps clupeoides TaxID=299321 RepID=A0AAY4AEW7_9TELE